MQHSCLFSPRWLGFAYGCSCTRDLKAVLGSHDANVNPHDKLTFNFLALASNLLKQTNAKYGLFPHCEDVTHTLLPYSIHQSKSQDVYTQKRKLIMKVQQMAGHTHMHIYGIKQGSFYRTRPCAQMKARLHYPTLLSDL